MIKNRVEHYFQHIVQMGKFQKTYSLIQAAEHIVHQVKDEMKTVNIHEFQGDIKDFPVFVPANEDV